MKNQYMYRCFQLAKNGKGVTSPNPLVGCVIVHNDKIIGEGFHKEYGFAHAEVNAINSVKDKSLLKESTLYVNLEPCAHFGKTPPCANLIVKHQLKKVVISNVDPFKEVSGKGIQLLKNAGIEVEVGVLEKEGFELNKRFFTFHIKKRPYIFLKWAQSANGYLDFNFIKQEKISIPISSNLSRQLVHKWRSEESAILVGKNTVINDNPSLTVRLVKGKNPIRIIIDPQLNSPENALIFNDQSSTIIYNQIKSGSTNDIEWVKFEPNNFLNEILENLYQKNIQSVLVEGGAFTLSEFYKHNLWDEARVFTSNIQISGKTKAPFFNEEASKVEIIDNDLLKTYYNINA